MKNAISDPAEFVKLLAKNYLSKQERREGDYINTDGILVCGACGEHRQTFTTIDDPCEGDPERKTRLLVTKACRCDREEEAREKLIKEYTEDNRRLDALPSSIRLMSDEKFRGATFESFAVDQHNRKALKLCRRYVARFDQMVENNQGLLFWGGVGTGKSYAAACIANALMSQGIPVLMTSFVKVLEVIQSGGELENSIIGKMNRARLLIFDDLGAERDTGYALEKVYNCVDARYRKKRPVIFTTNLTIGEMKEEMDVRYSRIYDRIFETCYPLQFTGPSWRRRAASKRFHSMERFLEED